MRRNRSTSAAPTLERGDLLPAMVTRPPGPRARRLASELAGLEAPGVNTLVAGETRMVLAEALGANLLDVDGNRYVDLTAGFGVAAIGHRHPELVEMVRRQAGVLLHGLGDVHAHPERIAAARALCARAPVEEPRVYWAVSGADAVEVALKTALLHTGSLEVVAFDPAYHGLTLGALRVTSRPAFRQPFAAALEAHTSRFTFGAPLDALARRLDATPRVGACVVEPMVGREGIVPPPAGWLTELAALCRRHDALLIADEIFTGVGRTGTFWAGDVEGIRPDVLCCGKAIAGGLPIAAAIARREVFAAWETPGEARHTATFLAHPLACRAVTAVLQVVERERLVERAATLGRRLGERLHAAAAGREVRGRGMAWAVVGSEPQDATRWADALLERGVLALAGGAQGRVLQVTPPLTIAEAQLDHAIDELAAVLATDAGPN